jgi:hypothetical protein
VAPSIAILLRLERQKKEESNREEEDFSSTDHQRKRKKNNPSNSSTTGHFITNSSIPRSRIEDLVALLLYYTLVHACIPKKIHNSALRMRSN